MNNDKSAKVIFNLLGFQYKPLQASLLKDAPADFVKKYKSASYAVKIRVLDKYAADLGY